MRRLLATLLLATLALSAAHGADNIIGKDGNGNPFTLRFIDVAGVKIPAHVLVDAAGNPWNTTTNLLRVKDDGVNAAFGTSTSAAVTNPATNATLIAYVRGLLTSLGAPGDAAWVSGNGSIIALLKSLEGTVAAQVGSLTETAPGSDTASSGLNGRLQRVAQNLSTLATDIGPPGATACATDTSSCSLNALAQRIAQRLTSLIALIPPTSLAPSATQAAASNSILSAAAKNLFSLDVTIGATSGWVMVFDAVALPSNGATTSTLKYCAPVLSNGTVGAFSKEWRVPLSFATGITVGFSSTACNSLTASATAFFYGQVQ